MQNEELFFQKEQKKERRQKAWIKKILLNLQKAHGAQAGESLGP